jgi:hypothetical protein
MNKSERIFYHGYALRLALLFSAAVNASCGGGSGGTTNADSDGDDPPTDPPLACVSEPVPDASTWHLKTGFPVCYSSGAGFFPQGPQNGIVLGNVDSNPDLEILLAATATVDSQSLFVFKHSGIPVPEWPPAEFPKGTAPFVLAEFSGVSADVIFAGTDTVNYTTGENYLTAAAVDTGILIGWPRVATNFVRSFPAAHDANGDGFDEFFTDEEDHLLHAYEFTGEPLPGWPTDPGYCGGVGGQQVVSLAFGDLDHDGQSEVAAVSRSPNGTNVHSCLMAFNMDGSTVPGFPIGVLATARDPTITLGDVDSDGDLEIMYVIDQPMADSFTEPPVLLVISATGVLEHTIELSGQLLFSASASVLSDLDGDEVPEILVLTEGTLNVVRGNGTPLAGFPVAFSQHTSGGSVPTLENCGAVIGDIDGDLAPDIVFCVRTSDGRVELWAVDRNGSPLQDAPLTLAANGATPRGPAIGDIDHDGQNEIVVATQQTLWVLRYGNFLPGGEVLWGQWGHDSRHTNRYP